jgi:hypothetical protein
MLPGHRFQLFRLAKRLSPARLEHFSFSISLPQFFLPGAPEKFGVAGLDSAIMGGCHCKRPRMHAKPSWRNATHPRLPNCFSNSSHLFLPPDNFLFGAVKTEAGPQSALELTLGLNFLFGKAFRFPWYDNK